MKERPIIFSGAMVSAIIDGRKTQTRRAVKPQPLWVADPSVPFRTPDADPKGIINCPYGRHGDRLWVRETWAPLFEEDTGFCGVQYAAGGMAEEDKRAEKYLDGTDRWRSPIFMPRWASRITLEVVSVRVERLNEISEGDAEAEGVERLANAPKFFHGYGKKGPNWHRTARESFQSAWEAINGPGSYAENPFVWVVEFRRL